VSETEKAKAVIEDIKAGAVRVWPLLMLQPLRIAVYVVLPAFLLGVAVGRFLLR
jgi:hypothetical protein